MAFDPVTLGAAVQLAKDPATIKASVEDWLDDHPEATTTVEDGSITKAKLHDDLADEIEQNTTDVGVLKSAMKRSNDFLGFTEYETSPGYYYNDGTIKTASSTTKEVYTTKIPVVTGTTQFIIESKFSEAKAQWMAFCQYGFDNTFINRTVIINETIKNKEYKFTVTNANCAYVAFCWRTYGEDAVTIKTMPNELHDSIIKTYAEEGKYAWFYSLLEHYYYDTTEESWREDNKYLGIRTVQFTSEELVISTSASIRFRIITAQADGTITNVSSWDYYTKTIPANTYYYFVSDRGSDTTEFDIGLFVSNVVINGDEPQTTLTRQVENSLILGEDSYRRGTTVWNWRNNHIKSINHRGFNKYAPENTIPAYKLSKQKGFNYVETDVCFTSDNVAVLLHDGSINRTARNADGTAISGTVNINNITYEQALAYDFGIWKGEEYAGTKIPTFEQFISLCRNIGLHPYIELKSDGGYTQEQIVSLVSIVKKYGMLRHVTWISFANTYLEYVKGADSKARLGYVCNVISASAIEIAVGLKNENNEVFIDVSKDNLTDALIENCMDADIPLEVWSVNAPSAIITLNPYISGVTSDYTIAWEVLSEQELLYRV